jgi:hypothetical protein
VYLTGKIQSSTENPRKRHFGEVMAAVPEAPAPGCPCFTIGGFLLRRQAQVTRKIDDSVDNVVRGVDNPSLPVNNLALIMTTAITWSRAQALSVGDSPVERAGIALPGLLVLLGLVRSITGS